MRRFLLLCSLSLVLCCSLGLPTAHSAEPLRALIVDGQNNHGNWPQTTKMMKAYLEQSGLFTVDVITHAPQGEDPGFKPAFADYAVVVSNFGHGAAPWPAETRQAFEDFVRGGGGLVVQTELFHCITESLEFVDPGRILRHPVLGGVKVELVQVFAENRDALFVGVLVVGIAHHLEAQGGGGADVIAG